MDKRLVMDWAEFEPVTPSFIGTKVYKDFPLEDLVPFIDWKPFFDVWQLRGKYPNGRYPKIFKDPTVGDEAKKLFDDVQSMLKDIIREKTLKARGIVAFYPANSSGEDIVLYTDETKSVEKCKLYGLRQQVIFDGMHSPGKWEIGADL